MLRTTPSLDTNTSRLVGGPSGVQQQLTSRAAGKKGTPEPAPLGAVVGEHWRARSVLGTLPDGQKTGILVDCFKNQEWGLSSGQRAALVRLDVYTLRGKLCITGNKYLSAGHITLPRTVSGH